MICTSQNDSHHLKVCQDYSKILNHFTFCFGFFLGGFLGFFVLFFVLFFFVLNYIESELLTYEDRHVTAIKS